MKQLSGIHPVLFMIVATILEVSGDAIIRKCIYNYTGAARALLFVLGAILLLGYGILLNLAPVEFSKIVGLYIATLFLVWQIQLHRFSHAAGHARINWRHTNYFGRIGDNFLENLIINTFIYCIKLIA